MSATSPPRSPRPSDLVDRHELEALVEALIEEARRRAQRRRRRNVAFVLLAVLAAGGLYTGLEHLGGGSTDAATASTGGTAAAAQGGGARWGLPHGPDGGFGNTVAVAPSAPETVYLGTGRGVSRSTNGGRSWEGAGLVPPTTPFGSSVPGVTSLLVDPRAPGTAYAGLNGRWQGGTTYRRHVFKTTDGGKTWRRLGLRGQPVAISPTAPPTVYVAAGGPGVTSRLVRSADGGRSWQPADSGLPTIYLWSFAFAPATPGTVYAAMGQRGIFESSDGGAHWRAVDVSPAYGDVTAIAVDPLHPQTVYAGTDAGVIKSLDGGLSWRLANRTLGAHGRDRSYGQVSALLVDPVNSATVYATTVCTGVFKSSDGGSRWSPANAGLDPGCSSPYALALDPGDPQIVYAADQARGVLKSLDGGGRWQLSNKGLSLTTVSSLAVDPQNPRTVYASTLAPGLFESDDGGTHWRPLASGPKLVEGLALDSSNPRNILAIAAAYGVERSTDAGRTWNQAHFGPGLRHAGVVAVSGKTAYAGSFHNGVFGSTDGGRSWRALGPPGVVDVQALAISPADPAVVYAGSVYGLKSRGLYKSTDGGSNWTRLALDADASTVSIDPRNPATVYVGTSGGEGAVFKSTDGGSSWQRADVGLPRWRAKTRTDNGRKWFMVSVGVNALAIDPAHPEMLYAATSWRGIFQSTDSGKSWHSFNAGLTDLDVRALAVDATGQTLYAGTAGGGVVSLQRNR